MRTRENDKSLLETDDDCRLQLPERYEILALIGRRTLGNVFRVRDREIGEEIALKALRQEYVGQQWALTRLRHEAKTARRIRHPNVIQVFDIGFDAAVPYLSLELIKGQTLTQALRGAAGGEGLGWRQAVAWARQIALGLQAAHDAGEVHGALEPSNVLIGRDGRVVLTDFGTPSILDEVLGVASTRLPLASEDLDGESSDPGVDLHALGAILHEMVCCSLGESSDAQQRSVDSPDRALPGPLLDLRDRLLSSQPSRRPASAREVAAALQDLVAPSSQDLSVEPSRPWPDLTRAVAARRCLTILPLRSGSGEASDYLVEQVARELARELEALGVDVRDPVEAIASTDEATVAPLGVGRHLGVDAIVEGSLRRSGDALRMRLAMVSVDDGLRIWGEVLSSASGDILALCTEAAVAMARALLAEVTEDARPRGPRAPSPATQDLLLRARHQMQHDWHRGMGRALTLFDEALAQEPRNARLLCEAARARARQAYLDPAGGHLVVARELAADAQQEEPQWPEPLVALAEVAFQDGELPMAIEHCWRALSLQDNHPECHGLLGHVLLEVGPLDRAIEHLERALQVNGLLYECRWSLALALGYLERWEEAEAWLERPVYDRVQRLNAGITSRRLHTWRHKRTSKTLARAALSLVSADHPFHGFLATSVRASEQGLSDAQRLEALDHYVRTIDSEMTEALQLAHLQMLAEVAALAGQHAVASSALVRACERGLRDWVWVLHFPHLAPLREEPAFGAVLQEVRRRTRQARRVYLEAWREHEQRADRAIG